MTLTARIVALVSVALFPALAIQGYNEFALRSVREARVKEDALRISRAASSDIEQLGEGVRQVLDLVTLEPSLMGEDAAACAIYLAKAQAVLSGAISIAFTKPDGTLICNSRGSPPGSHTDADRPYFRRAIESGGFSVGDYAEGMVTKTKSIHFALPKRAADGSIAGVVIASLDLAWLASRVQRVGLAPDTAISVIDSQGTVLARVPDHADWVGRKVSADRLVTIEQNVDQARDTVAWDGRRRIVGIARPSGALGSLTVSVGHDRDAAFADIDAATRRGTILIVAGGLLALLGAILGERMFIRRPLKRLLSAARSWQAGDLTARTGLSGSSEFGRLGEAFDAMAISLAQHRDELNGEVVRTRALQEQQTIMLHELNHRVQNTLATVQSLVRQSRSGDDRPEKLEDRIISLSKTHRLLTREEWSGAPLREILENELSPFRNSIDHFTLAGPHVDLPPRYVLALGMTFHELTTNAAKYGALSTGDGRVRVTWDELVTEGGASRLRLEWLESGGPPVRLPERKGFGTRLISGGISRELAGDIELDFHPDGLRCRMDIPIEEQRQFAA